jgi:pimeloyl-ACP methyl ester carboxylesterase
MSSIAIEFRHGAAAQMRKLLPTKEATLFSVGALLLAIHTLDDAFVQPEAGSAASDNLLTGLAGVAIVMAMALSYSRLRTGWRAAAAFFTGTYALVTALAIHVPHAVSLGFGGSDFTALASGASGLWLAGIAVWLVARCLPNIWTRLGLVPAGLLFLIVFFFPVLLAVGVTNTARVPLSGDTPSDRGFAYQDVTFETDDGLTISAWYIPSENGAAVIAVHGAGKNRTKTLDHAEMLAGHGYGVLMIDLRGYGESEGSINSMGWNGYRDISAAVQFLESQPDVDEGRVGGLGLSMGGETLLQAAGEENGSGLAAVISEGAGARTYREVLKIPGAAKYIMTAPLFVREAAISLLTGDKVPPANDGTVAQFAPSPIMLISGEITEERNWNRIMRDRSPESVELFEAEGGHIDGLSTQPREYESRVIAFLDRTLLED